MGKKVISHYYKPLSGLKPSAFTRHILCLQVNIISDEAYTIVDLEKYFDLSS
jgi:hypothetical protein